MPLKDWVPPRLLSILGLDRATTIDLMNAGQTPTMVAAVEADEFGVSGTENFGGYLKGEDFNPELDDFRSAVKIYEKMRRTDAQVHAMLSVIKLPLRGATWLAMPPEGGDPVDEQIAKFVNKALFDDDAMDESWDYVLRHILMQLDFGFSVLESVWRCDDDGHFVLKRLAPRLPKTIREWHVTRNGKLRAIVQYAPVPSSREVPASGRSRTATYQTTVSYQYLTIPAAYAAVFVLEREGDNYEGWSSLRTVFRSWWYKDQAYRIHGVALDRWGVGIPVAELEDGHNLSKDQLDTLSKVLQGIRANERAYLVAPPHVRYRILPEGSGGSSGPDVIGWVDHHDSQIARNVLAGFLTVGRDSKGLAGPGLGSRLTDMFVSSLNGVAKGICGDLKHQVVKPLCEMNFDMTRRQLPTIVCRDLEQVDLSNLVQVLAQISGTYITPDDDIETMLRKMLRLPPLAPDQTRKAKATAAPGSMAAAGNVQDAAAAGQQKGDAMGEAAASAKGGGAHPHLGGEPALGGEGF